jgi:hypothetical protein
MIFSSIEGGIGLTAANIVTLRPLIKSLAPRSAVSSNAIKETSSLSKNAGPTANIDIENRGPLEILEKGQAGIEGAK